MRAVKVLVVDDEAIASRNLQYILVKEGYTVDIALNGEQALEKIAAAKEDPYHVVLTDLRMPGVDGMQVLAKAKEFLQDVEVIMITGYATANSALEAVSAGACHYVAKPYNIGEVRLIVREALEKRALKQENRVLRERLAQANEKNM